MRREYYLANREKVLASNRKYRESHREQIREQRRKYREAHQDHILTRIAKWRAAHPEKVRAYNRKHEKSHRQERRAYLREWRRANPERDRACIEGRRARRQGSPGAFSAGDVRMMLRNQKGRCWWCGCVMAPYTVDHRIALAKGGTNDPGNLVLACGSCNSSKHTRTPEEFAGRLL